MASGNRISPLESLLLLILGGFAVTFLLETPKLGQTAALFPRLVAGASLFLFIIALGSWFFTRAAPVQRADSSSIERPPNAMSSSAAFALQVGYIAMVVLLGFPVATLIYLIGSPRLMRYPRWKILIPYGVLLTGAVFVAFVYLLHVRLPEGLLWSSFIGSR